MIFSCKSISIECDFISFFNLSINIFRYEVPTTNTQDEFTVLLPVYLREKKSSLTYSPSNLFGQPLLIGVPREHMTYEKLYEIVLNSMSRYVTPPSKSDQDWWKPKSANIPPATSTTTTATAETIVQNGNDRVPPAPPAPGSSSSAENKSEETTPSSEGVPPSPLSSSEANNELEDDDDDEMMVEEEDGRGPPKLFVMNFVNSYGNAQLEQLCNDGKPIKLTGELFDFFF